MVLIDPRPDLINSESLVYEFEVDEPISTLIIPLNGDDTVMFDFGFPYQKSFEEKNLRDSY